MVQKPVSGVSCPSRGCTWIEGLLAAEQSGDGRWFTSAETFGLSLASGLGSSTL